MRESSLEPLRCLTASLTQHRLIGAVSSSTKHPMVLFASLSLHNKMPYNTRATASLDQARPTDATCLCRHCASAGQHLDPGQAHHGGGGRQPGRDRGSRRDIPARCWRTGSPQAPCHCQGIWHVVLIKTNSHVIQEVLLTCAPAHVLVR